MTFLLPPYPTFWQSGLNTAARVILLKEDHIMSLLCSKLSVISISFRTEAKVLSTAFVISAPLAATFPPTWYPTTFPTVIQLLCPARRSLSSGNTFQP